ncbi:hypothetical protein [Streptomyces xantholiticus]|uniref:hypothetical protein n=1 Tax=Streptomyces xantholiticus TaxID=68285 RepID=UPI001676776E|nr:hypothetical protein [Streptomyces xantholiticus]GGW74460.1 hypothetical protein GCM10010381_69040 [Streptomyces xantholiticus]
MDRRPEDRGKTAAEEGADLSIRVAAHPYCKTVDGEKRVAERMRLKQATRPAAAPVVDVGTAA